MSVHQRVHRPISVLLIAVLSAAMMVTTIGTAEAVATVLFDQSFAGNTASGTGAVVKPAPVTNAACLTATGNTTTGVLRSCTVANDATTPQPTPPNLTVSDAVGSGTLALTQYQINKAGGVFSATSVPTSQGLDVTFDLYQYSAAPFAADGIAFALSAVDPANPTAPPSMGPSGGSLGYSTRTGLRGLANGYLGIGFDVYGNFSNKSYQGTDCATSTLVKETTRSPGQVLVRGPGNGFTGYCALTGTGTTAPTSPVVPMHSAVSRAASKVPVEFVVNPNATSITTTSGFTVPTNSYLVAFTPIGGAQRQLTGALPVMDPSLVGSPSWLDADGLPKQLAFGWVGSTGANADNHEVANVKVTSLVTTSQLTVSQLNYTPSAATTTTALPSGSPISYVVTPGVTGLAEVGTISVTETVPAGIAPLAASGTGWVCAAPVGQTVTCANANGPFASGASLSPVTVTAVVTGAAVSQSTVQTSSVVTASSDTGLAAYSNSSTTAANPAAPAITALSPVGGLVAGGNQLIISGTNLTGATSIQIGTTAEFSAGTNSTLLPCATVAAPGCFTVSGSTLVISSMPAHAVAAVTVKVVNLGAAGSASYNYTSVPTTPVVTATLSGARKATVNWTATNGGLSITGFTVTPFRDGVAQTAVNLGGAVNSQQFISLSAGSTYTFQVVATNANGDSAAGISPSVVPYTLPAAPTSPSAVASSGQAVVSWTAPSNGWSPITGYVVTPSLAGVPKTAQTFLSPNLSQAVTGLTAGGSYTFTVQAINAAGTGPASVATTPAVIINAPPALALAPPVAGEVGVAYSNAAFTVGGGTGPFTWTLESGSLPTGLTLDAAGVISGNPTAAGVSSFTVLVTDAAGKTATQSLSITIAAAPALALPAPPIGDVGQPYSNQFTVTGGTAPFRWGVTAGTLPAGLLLDPDTGVLAGTPTAGGTSTVTVAVTDVFGLGASQQVQVVIRVAVSTVSLAASVGSTTPGGSVTLTATVGPTGTTGTVTFRDTITAGPQAGYSAVVATVPVVANGTATATTTLAQFGAHVMTASYGGDPGHGAAGPAPTTVEVAATPGSLLVGEFRLSGPGGPGDDYVELTNVSPNPLALEGFQLTTSSGAVSTLPNGSPMLPTGRSFLVTGPGFSLGTVAHSDYAPGADLGTGGIAVLAPDTAKTVTDAVGPNIAGYHLGTPLPALTGEPAEQYGWVRIPVAGALKNTQANGTDFALVSATGGTVGGVQSMLGSASPTGLTDPWKHSAVLRSFLLDPSVAVGASPNRLIVKVQPGTPGILTVRRLITNTSGGTITAMKTRITAISEANGLGRGAPEPGPTAFLRVINPATATTVITVAGAPVTVQNLTVDPPAGASPGGGLNTTLAVPLPPGGLAPGASVAVAFTFAADTAGTFWFGYDVEALG